MSIGATYLSNLKRRPIGAIAMLAFRTIPVLVAAGGMALAAQVRVPVPGTSVPMTLQSLGMLLTGLWLTPAQAIAAMLLYLGAGTIGLPVFASGSSAIFGPTGGYLVGFVIGAGAIAWLSHRSRHWLVQSASAMAGLVILFALGTVGFVLSTETTPHVAVAQTVAPFVMKGLVEVGVAVSTAQVIGRIGRS